MNKKLEKSSLSLLYSNDFTGEIITQTLYDIMVLELEKLNQPYAIQFIIEALSNVNWWNFVHGSKQETDYFKPIDVQEFTNDSEDEPQPASKDSIAAKRVIKTFKVIPKHHSDGVHSLRISKN